MSMSPHHLEIGYRYANRRGRVRQIVDLDGAEDVTWFEVGDDGQMTEKAGGCTRASFFRWAERRVRETGA